MAEPMSAPDQATQKQAAGPPYEPTEEDVKAVLAEFDGDGRKAIAALLRDLDTLARDHRRRVSLGYVRGGLYPDLDTLKLP